MNIKTDSKLLELICTIRSFFFGWAWLMCPLATSMFMTIACYCGEHLESRQCTATSHNQAESCVKEALQWRLERRVQVQSYVNQNEMASELWNWTYNAITSLALNGTFVRRTTDLEKTLNMNWLPFSLSVNTIADEFLFEGNVWAHVSYSRYDAIQEKARLYKRATRASTQSSPKAQFHSYWAWTWNTKSSEFSMN